MTSLKTVEWWTRDCHQDRTVLSNRASGEDFYPYRTGQGLHGKRVEQDRTSGQDRAEKVAL